MPDRAAAVEGSMSDAELLDMLGPSWGTMSDAERRAYGPRAREETADREAPAERDAALRLWCRELERGIRTRTTHDTLRIAAEWEAGARELDAQGSHESAARCRATARQIILEAARHRRKSA